MSESLSDTWKHIDELRAKGERERAETKAALEDIISRGTKWTLSTASRSIVWTARHKVLGEISAPTSLLLLERVRTEAERDAAAYGGKAGAR